jgi:hypothetical protein
MTRPAITIGPDETVTHAARLMYSRRVKRLPTIAEDGKLIGIVSRADVLSVYSRSDADIRHEVIEDLILKMYLCALSGVICSSRRGGCGAAPVPGEPGRGRDAQHQPRMRAGPQGCPQAPAQGGGPGAVWWPVDVYPFKGAELGQRALPDASFQAVDEDLVTEVPGRSEVPGQLLPVERRHPRRVGDVGTRGRGAD